VVVLGQGQPAPPVSDYNYTYVAINTATGLIAAVNAGADFTALPGGTYRVYGMSYKSANPPPAVVNPASLVGLSLEGAFATSQCIHFSGNFVNVTVTGGCTLAVFASTDVPKAISASGTPMVTSTLSIPTSGTISDVNVLNLDIDHTYINDLRVKLKSPANTERILLNQICSDQDNILISFDDESSNTYASIPCPPNGVMHQPNQTLSPFDGENLAGTWTLTIEDVADQDGGTLQSWSIEVCYNSCPDILPVNSNPVVSGTYEAQQAITSAGTIANNGNVLFKAGTSVELLPHFEIIIGGVFKVIMVGCIP
jgi:subtilisin-like proprotein convertase family protein